MTLDEAEKSIAIFKKYATPERGVVEFIFSAEHDEVYGGPDPDVVSDEDKAALEELGWHVSGYDSFCHFV